MFVPSMTTALLVLGIAMVAATRPWLGSCCLILLALRTVRLYPPKTIDIGWWDLLAALRFLCLPSGRSRSSLEGAITKKWSKQGDGMVFLSVRTGIDLVLAELNLPQGSEVLFVPGITIPSMVSIVEGHGLRPVGVAPPSASRLLAPELGPHVTEGTRVLVLTHLFGTIFDFSALIAEAKQRGIFVIEDLAQSFVGAARVPEPSRGRLPEGFRGHEASDASFTSFGMMKTLTAVGGSVGRIRDAKLREAVKKRQAAYPEQPRRPFLWKLMKAMLVKLFASPTLWGLASALLAVVGFELDTVLIGFVRSFSSNMKNLGCIRKRPCMALLQLLHRRLQDQQHLAVLQEEEQRRGRPASSVLRRCAAGGVVAERLAAGGATIPSFGEGECSWWLFPVLDDNPKLLVRSLRAKGFAASCTSTQLMDLPCVSAGTQSLQGRPKSLMDRVVYLPVNPGLSRRAAKDLAAAVLQAKRDGAGAAPASCSGEVGVWAIGIAAAVLSTPRAVLWFVPSLRLSVAVLVFLVLVVIVGRWLAADRQLKIAPKFLRLLEPRGRPTGVAAWREDLLKLTDERVDGAVLLTGATGFVGGGILFGLLASARDLGITRIVLLVRAKRGCSPEARIKELRADPAFAEVRDAFDELVVGMEGDVAEKDLGRRDEPGAWPHPEPLRVVLHCAAAVSFQQPLQQAAVAQISGSLQVAHLAAQWGAKRFVLVSTAFVHAIPRATGPLEERLVELRDFNPLELYRDAVAHGKWAERAMRDLGFPNTYTFTKAIAEHLVLQACDAQNLEVRVVRPSIVCPAWASPSPGWAGKRPSTVILCGVLMSQRFVRVLRVSSHPSPMVPVDLVASLAIRACVSSEAAGTRIMHATLDASQTDQVPSQKLLLEHYHQLLTLLGDFSAAEAGLHLKLLRWANSPTAFWALHVLLNDIPIRVAAAACQVALRVASSVGLSSKGFEKQCKLVQLINNNRNIPTLYLPFSCPSTAWTFASSLRLPANWDLNEYSMMLSKVALTYSRGGGGSPSTESLQDVTVISPRSVWRDAFAAMTMPGSSFILSVSSFWVRRALNWMDLTVTVDVASLVAVSELSKPLALCPTHRSLLDFVILGAVCCQLNPSLPKLQLPHVAADAEFSGLPLLGRVLVALGAFFVRRGGGGVQPDPALRAEVGRVFRKGKPLEVFLEGLRSRGRRQLRLRSGLLRALRDVAERTVALVPVALSYELLPEDCSFYSELQGLPRPPLRTGALVEWALRGLLGELPASGSAHVRLGSVHLLEASSDLGTLLSEVQEELVELTTCTAVHTRALAEVLDLPPSEVHDAVRAAGMQLRPSKLGSVPLGEGQRWALAIQLATLLRRKLPEQWAYWLVEPIAPRVWHPPAPQCETPAVSCTVEASPTGAQCKGTGLDIDGVAASLSAKLAAAEDLAYDAARAMQDCGTTTVIEEHLFQQLLHAQGARPALPAPLARGAASIVAGRLHPGPRGDDEGPSSEGAAPGAAAAEGQAIAPLWPAGARAPAEHRKDDEALERWGFKDTRLVAQYVDGRAAVQMTSRRYSSLTAGRPSYALWPFLQKELRVSLSVHGTMQEEPLPEVPPPAEGLVERLEAAVPADRVQTGAEARLRSCTGHGLADIWRLRTRQAIRAPDAVVRPQSEEEVMAILSAAAATPFAVVPVGGRTNVTSATVCPARAVDPRPFVALDMRGLSKVLWVNTEDGVAHVGAGITGSALKDALAARGVTMGMEPDSMEFSTVGGWIATRASGMKRAKYGNIEDMVVEVRVATPSGVLWQHHNASEASALPTAYGRASTNASLPGLILGSEGCLGVVTSAVIRVQPLPQVVTYQSVVFPDWEQGARWMREVARLPPALRPASCRLMDNRQLQLAQALRGDDGEGALRSGLKEAVLRLQGIHLDEAVAATLVFEGTRREVAVQRQAIKPLVRRAAGVWGGASKGEAGYALTFAIAYLRDLALDHRILSESLETLVPWSAVGRVWPRVLAAVHAEHAGLCLPGQPFLSCRMTQLYSEGAVLYMYIGVPAGGLTRERALEAFEQLERAARRAILEAGGCLSHHHGVGKLRAEQLEATQAAPLAAAMHGLKAAVDPSNVLAARNGLWASMAEDEPADRGSQQFFDASDAEAPTY